MIKVLIVSFRELNNTVTSWMFFFFFCSATLAPPTQCGAVSGKNCFDVVDKCITDCKNS